jgi:hypothetical protein
VPNRNHEVRALSCLFRCPHSGRSSILSFLVASARVAVELSSANMVQLPSSSVEVTKSIHVHVTIVCSRRLILV